MKVLYDWDYEPQDCDENHGENDGPGRAYLADIARHPDCRDPEHPGCSDCEPELFEDYENGY